MPRAAHFAIDHWSVVERPEPVRTNRGMRDEFAVQVDQAKRRAAQLEPERQRCA